MMLGADTIYTQYVYIIVDIYIHTMWLYVCVSIYTDIYTSMHMNLYGVCI